MKKGLFIEPYDYREVVLKDKGPIYFVEIDRSIKEEDNNLEEDFFENLMASPSSPEITEHIVEKEYVFYVKCFECDSEYFQCISDSLIENKIKNESYLLELKNSFKFKSKLNLPKSITRTCGEEIIEKLEETFLLKQLKKIGFICPYCKEDKFNISCRKSTNIFLNEDEKYFQIKSYGVVYATKDIKNNNITSLYRSSNNVEDLKIIVIKHSFQFIFDKLSNNIYFRYSDGGKYKLINGTNIIHHQLYFMNLEGEEIFISFIKEILKFYHLKLSKYQKKSLDFTQEINDTNNIMDLLDIFNNIKYHLNFPFAFELFGKKINNIISYESKYFKNKIKKAKSGDEILNLYLNSKGLTKKVRNKLKENPGYFDSNNRKNNYYKYGNILYLIRNHDNKGLNESVFNFILKEANFIELNRESPIKKASNNKNIDYKSMYNTLKKYILIDNVLKSYIKSKDLIEYNRYIQDTVNLILLIDSLLKKNKEGITNNQRKAIKEAKKSLNSIKNNKNLSLEKLHDKLTLLHDEINTSFEEYIYTKEEAVLNYKEGDVSIHLYENSIQLKQSASKLKICAYSYSNRIKRKEIILFELREVDKEKMCIEVVGNRIIQAKLNSNKLINEKTPRNIINTLKSWIKVKDLKIATNDLTYIN